MPALGKAKSHNWVEADLAFGDLGDLGAKKVSMNIEQPWPKSTS